MNLFIGAAIYTIIGFIVGAVYAKSGADEGVMGGPPPVLVMLFWPFAVIGYPIGLGLKIIGDFFDSL